MGSRVLVVGNQEMLLATRKDIVERTHEAVSASPDQTLSLLHAQCFDLILLCHSVRGSQAKDLIEAVHKQHPLIIIVRLSPIGFPDISLPLVDRVVVAKSNPREWMAVISDFLPTGPALA